MITLPKILLDADLPRVLRIHAALTDSANRVVDVSAAEVLQAEPVAICILADAFRRVSRRNGTLRLHAIPSSLRAVLESLQVKADFVPTRSSAQLVGAPTEGALVAARDEANAVANAIARRVASFIPSEDLEGVLCDKYGLAINNAVQPALAYVLTELLDNVFSHARSADFPRSVGWVAVQYYPTGDRVRLCVVDDGCGFLTSMNAGLETPLRAHSEAINQAFRPFVSSKLAPGMYVQRTHMGMGLTVCRDLCLKHEGRIYAASGNGWVHSPSTAEAESRRLEVAFQGSILSLEFHRRGITPWTIGNIVDTYNGSSRSGVRFSS